MSPTRKSNGNGDLSLKVGWEGGGGCMVVVVGVEPALPRLVNHLTTSDPGKEIKVKLENLLVLQQLNGNL